VTLHPDARLRMGDAATLVAEARLHFAGEPEPTARLQAIADRLAEPLRVAVAGRLKAGKSTLLNALIGEEIAPTDTGECTRVVTWYRYAQTPAVRLVPIVGDPVERPVRLAGHRLLLDLGGRATEEIARIEVSWPAPLLTQVSLIDTPGLASLSTEVSARSEETLTAGEGVAEVDAILYLMRHLHAEDADFLTEFIDGHDLSYLPATTLILLARADEIGGGRIDAMVAAGRIADRYRHDPLVRRMCLDVLPVAGLLGQAAATLRQREFDALAEIAVLDREERQRLLVSADRFVSTPLRSAVATPEMRLRLLQRLGVFGVRLATTLIKGGIGSATALSDALLLHSNVATVKDVFETYLTSRSRALRERNALLALDRLLAVEDSAEAITLRERVALTMRGETEPEEMLALVGLRTAPPQTLSPEQVAEAERILGGSGTDVWVRLGTGRSATPGEIDVRAVRAVAAWRRVEASPAQSAAATQVAAGVIRTLEAILARVRGHG
jgi:hypothetical protein